PMSPAARQLFDVLREEILKLDSTIIELAEQTSVSYHGPVFFLEGIPRKSHIALLLPLNSNEIEDPSGIAEDAYQWKFIVNAEYEGGVYVSARNEADIDKTIPMIRLAREVSRT